MTFSNHAKADLLLVVVTLLAAAGWIFSKEALAGFAPIFFIATRFSGAGLILLSFGFQEVRAISRPDLIKVLGVGLLFGLAMVFWILGLQYGQHIGVGAFLTSLGAVFVPVVARCLGEVVSPTTWLSLLIAAAGLGCLSLDEGLGIGWGEVSYLIAALLFACFF